MSGKYWWIWAGGAALLITLWWRLPDFGTLPRGLNRDEAALAYNAYSLWRTGTDEHGIRWPVSIQSFGDQKLPGYVYTLIPFVALGGLHPVTIRLPSLLASLVVVAGVGGVAYELLPRRSSPRERRLFTLGAMLLVALSPWDNHFARVAYEAHLAMAAFVAGFACWLRAQRATRSAPWIIASALALSATLLTYHSYHILTPLFLGLLLFTSPIKSMNHQAIFSGLLIGTLTICLLIFGGVLDANQVKMSGISPFASTTLLERMFMLRQAVPGSLPLEKFWANRPLEALDTFGRNLTETLASDFLFTTTTAHHVHNLSGIGNLHRFLAPFLLLGVVALWELRRLRSTRWLAGWLLLGLVPAALTISPQHTVRLSPVFPALELLAALGMWFVWKHLQRWRRTFLAVLVGVALFSASRWWVEYHVLAPQRDQAWSHERFMLLGAALARYQPEAYQVVTQSPADSPYIWYLLSSRFDPARLNTAIERYPTDREGFMHVRRINNVYFETAQWPDLQQRAKSGRLILIFRPTEVPDDIRQSGLLRLQETLTDHYGSTAYEVWELAPGETR